MQSVFHPYYTGQYYANKFITDIPFFPPGNHMLKVAFSPKISLTMLRQGTE